MNLKENMIEIIMDKDEIEQNCVRLRNEIEKHYENVDEPVICLGLLKGCFPFMTDLLRDTSLRHVCDYMDVSSYFGNEKAEDEVQIIKDMTMSCKDKNILIVEDIVDSARTIKKVMDLLYFRGAKNIEVVTMCDKPSGRTVDLTPKFIGKEVPDAFLVGYGLDYKEEYRNVITVGILDPKHI